MSLLSEFIISLRLAGKTYTEICNELQCSKSLVSYYCGEQQKEKLLARTAKYREARPLALKLSAFTTRKKKCFDRHGERNRKDRSCSQFTVKQLLAKLGPSPKCYLTGEPIDLMEVKTYEFDHIVPVSAGGDNSLENCGLALSYANRSKADIPLDKFLNLCVKVLSHHGYRITPPENSA